MRPLARLGARLVAIAVTAAPAVSIADAVRAPVAVPVVAPARRDTIPAGRIAEPAMSPGLSGTEPELPGPRHRHSAIFDPVGRRMLVFGGIAEGHPVQPDDQVWALSLVGARAWSPLGPSGTSPGPREGHSAIYDPVRHRMIVFGGARNGALNDVWALSLSGSPAWSPLATAGTPPTPRVFHTAIYDPVRDRMVVHGGIGGGTQNDTWALTLSGTPTWSRILPPGPGPPIGWMHSAVYDSRRDRMVLCATQGQEDGVWALALDGSTAWVEVASSGPSPLPRYAAGAVYDPYGDRMLLFGGADVVYHDDVHALSFAGSPTWSSLASSTTPPAPRSQHTAVLDVARRWMVVFGGIGYGGPANDSWALPLDGAPAWSQIIPTERTLTQSMVGIPASLHLGQSFTLTVTVVNEGLASDDGRIAVGFPGLAAPTDVQWVSSPGADDGPGVRTSPAGSAIQRSDCTPMTATYLLAEYIDDAWSAGGTETNVFTLTVQPPAVGTFDVDIRSTMHPAGGGPCDLINEPPDGGAGTVDQQGWAVARFTVTVLPIPAPGPPPPARFRHAAIHDPGRGRLVVFGGDAGSPDDRTWALSLGESPTWSMVVPSGTPPGPRYGHSAVLDPLRERMIVFGGAGAGGFADVWALSLAGAPAWSRLLPAGSAPAARDGHSAIYDPVRDRMIVFGGSSSAAFDDVWALDLAGFPTWSRIVPVGPVAEGPGVRTGHAAVYDPVRDRMLVFGGQGSGGPTGDLWALPLSGTPTWTLVLPATPGAGPDPRSGHTLTYDPVRDRLWLVGGFGTAGNDVWMLDLAGGAGWSDGRTWGEPMPGRAHHAAIADPAGDRLVIFGGRDAAAQRRDDTWFLTRPYPPNWQQLGSPPPPPPPTLPVPTFTALVSPGPATLVLGQTFSITLTVRNDGWASDDGRMSVSFPGFTDPADSQWVSVGGPAGDLPGYVELPAGAPLVHAGCPPVSAPCLVAEYRDEDWLPFGVEENSVTLTVRPRQVGTFVYDVRSTMHKTGGGACEMGHGLPVGGVEGPADPQGWPVRRFVVTVVAPPTDAAPVFTAPVSTAPATIYFGQTFSLTAVVRNDGAASDDGRIVFGFPSFTAAADAQYVSSASGGDTPGYRESPAGSPLLDAACQPITASYLEVEYADSDWAWLGSEVNVLTVTVAPPVPGSYVVEVRSTLRTAGGGPCDYVNAVPAEGEGGYTDQRGWAVRRIAVTVLPAPPDPDFPSGVSLAPAGSITIGASVRITVSVSNQGAASDDGRIVLSFPSFTATGDAAFVTSASAGDTPGYREYDVGATLVRADCQPMIASYVTVEYADDAWTGAGGETNQLVVDVQPRAVGTFPILIRSTMRVLGAGVCDVVNDVPTQVANGTDQQGWLVREFDVVVGAAPPPVPVFTGPVTGIPASIALGENFRITATLRNDGPASDDGRISIAFPGLTNPQDGQWVASASGGDAPGYLERLPGSVLSDASCQPVGAEYLAAEYADDAWTTGESNTVSIVVQPRVEGPFHVDVRGTMRNAGLLAGPCDYRNGLPPNGVGGPTDQQGWPVRRFTVQVIAAPGPPPEATTTWTPVVPPPGGPTGRVGATAIYQSARQAMVIYGGSDPGYRSDVWSLPLEVGGAWSQLTPGGPVPLRRIMHTMIYNAFEDQAVIFGGHYDFFLNDTWVLGLGATPWWFPNPGQGPPPSPRGGHAAVYDPVRHRMLVIGGFDVTVRNDVWEYAPPGVGVWRPLTVGGTPMPPRAQHGAVYDPVRDRVIVFGGDGGTFRNDVWALNLAGPPTWEALSPGGTAPSGRREHAMIYDPMGDRVIVYGGYDGARRGDVWALSLGGTPAWTRLYASTVSPASRFGHTAVYDPPRMRMVVFGGDLSPGEISRELWALTFDVPTPVTLALSASEATPERVRLVWTGDGLEMLRAQVFRAAGADEEWAELGTPVVEGGDRLVFEDRAVTPGARYGYRLEVREGAEETWLDPVWITVPERAALALAGASPNPAEGELSVAFSLSDERAATLELFDLRGRRVASREVGPLGAGWHRVSLAEGRVLAAGVYLVRLTRGGERLTAKACVVR